MNFVREVKPGTNTPVRNRGAVTLAGQTRVLYWIAWDKAQDDEVERGSLNECKMAIRRETPINEEE